jgi:hypothetical protein
MPKFGFKALSNLIIIGIILLIDFNKVQNFLKPYFLKVKTKV